MALYIKGDYKADSSMILANMAMQGLGFSYLPEFTIAPYVKSGELCTVLDEWMPEPLDIFMVYPHKKYLSKKFIIYFNAYITIIITITYPA